MASDKLVSRPTDDVPDRHRFVDRLNPNLVNVLTVVGFGVPVIGYFWLLHRYSVNVIVGDQWDDVTVIGRSYAHLFDWSSLWAQHNENRILFPNLIVLLLAHTTHFNVQVEEYLSATMLVVATVLLIWAHKRRSPSAPFLYYCPVALLALSIVQYEDTLWGFQMAWYLVMLALATTIVLLDRPTLTWLILSGAIAAGVIGSFSSLQGLLIWPAGLVLLYHRRRRLSLVVAWIAAAVVSVALYFYNFNTHTGSPLHGYGWSLQHPLKAVKFYLFAVGDVVGVRQGHVGPGNNAVLLLGFVILVLALWTLISFGIRRDEQGGSPIGVALICVGLLFVATVTAARAIFGYYGAAFSRYTTFDLLIPIGIYLALLGRPASGKGRERTEPRCVQEPHSGGLPGPAESRLPARINRIMLPAARWVVAVVIALQVILGVYYGAQGARATYASKAEAARVLRNINHEPNGPVLFFLFPFGSSSFVREQARILEMHHLSLFDGVTTSNPSSSRSHLRQ